MERLETLSVSKVSVIKTGPGSGPIDAKPPNAVRSVALTIPCSCSCLKLPSLLGRTILRASVQGIREARYGAVTRAQPR
jgi:hypothetical protein